MGVKRKGTTLKSKASHLMSTISAEPAKARAQIALRQRKLFVEGFVSVIFGLLGSVLASLAVFLSSSYATQIPQAYAYLAGIILSSLAGISVVFQLARKFYRERKRERVEAIKGVRVRERQLFETLQHDFEDIVRHRELHG